MSDTTYKVGDKIRVTGDDLVEDSAVLEIIKVDPDDTDLPVQVYVPGYGEHWVYAAHIRPVNPMEITEHGDYFKVEGRTFYYDAKPDQIQREAEVWLAAAEHLRNHPEPVEEPTQYGARVEVDDPLPGRSGRVVVHRLNRDSGAFNWVQLLIMDGEQQYRSWGWRHLKNKNPKVLE